MFHQNQIKFDLLLFIWDNSIEVSEVICCCCDHKGFDFVGFFMTDLRNLLILNEEV